MSQAAPPPLQTFSMPLNADAAVFTPQLTTDIYQHFDQLQASVDQISSTMLLLFEAQRQLTSSVRLQLLPITANKFVVQEQMAESEQMWRPNERPMETSNKKDDMAECASSAAKRLAVQEQREEMELIRRLNGTPMDESHDNHDMAEYASCPAALNRKDDYDYDYVVNSVVAPCPDLHFTENLDDAEMDLLLARFGAESIFGVDQPTTEMADFIAGRRG